MSQHQMNHISKLLEGLVKFLGEALQQVMESLNVLKGLPQALSQIKDAINTGSNNVIQSQAEMEIYIRMAQMKSKEALIVSENEAIQEFQKQLDEDYQEIRVRYDKLDSDLNKDCLDRLNKLDAHLLGLPAKFPSEMYKAYGTELIPFLNDLVEDANDAYLERKVILDSAYQETRAKTAEFIALRKSLLDKVESMQYREQVDDSSTYYVPVWIMSTYKPDSGEETSVYLPSEYYESYSMRSIAKSLKPLAGIETSEDLRNKLINRLKWIDTDDGNEELINRFSSLLDEVDDKAAVKAKGAVIRSLKLVNIQKIGK